jgi:hypothetical protein
MLDNDQLTAFLRREVEKSWFDFVRSDCFRTAPPEERERLIKQITANLTTMSEKLLDVHHLEYLTTVSEKIEELQRCKLPHELTVTSRLLGFLVIRVRSRPPTRRHQPPTVASFLLDVLLGEVGPPGDIVEDFPAKLAKYGPTGARLWFWAEALRTIARRNPICRAVLVGGVVRLIGLIFRLIG